MKFELVDFQSKHKEIWDKVIEESPNGTLLSSRLFLSYHQNRFIDRSQLVLEKATGSVLAVIPIAESTTETAISHPGATYGGLFPKFSIGQSSTNIIVELLIEKLSEISYKKFIYKPTPHLFHKSIWENDLFAFHNIGIQEVILQPNSVLDLNNYYLGREKNRKKAKKSNCETTLVKNPLEFYTLLKKWLKMRHQVEPVHTLDELIELQGKFPNSFLFLETRVGNELVAGCLVIVINGVIHTQYFASSDLGLEVQALDNLVEYIATELITEKKKISFGSSSDKSGKILNDGLIAFKEGFGGTTQILQEFHIKL